MQCVVNSWHESCFAYIPKRFFRDRRIKTKTKKVYLLISRLAVLPVKKKTSSKNATTSIGKKPTGKVSVPSKPGNKNVKMTINEKVEYKSCFS